MNPILIFAAAAGAFLLLRKRKAAAPTETPLPDVDDPVGDPDAAAPPRRAAKDYAPAKTRGMKTRPKKPGGGIVFG